MANITREELYNIYRDRSARTYDPYSSRFTEANTAYISGTKKIHIEDMIDALAKAPIFHRDSDLPATKRQPHTRMTLEPLLLGSQEGISALDGIEKQVGQEIVVNGTVVDNNVFVIGKKLETIKTGIANTFGQMCGELLLTSKLTHPKLDIDFDEGAVSAKGNFTVDSTGKEMVTSGIVGLVQDFFSEKGFRPRVLIGRKVSDQIMQEINLSTGKNSKGDYKMVTNEDSGYNLVVDHMDVQMELFQPIKKMIDDSVIDTSSMIMLYAPETLTTGYGVLEIYDEATDTGILLRGDLAVGQGEINKITGRSSVHAFSAPLPVIVNNNLIERWNLVVT